MPEDVVGVVALFPVSRAVLLAAADAAGQGLRDVDVGDSVVVFVLLDAEGDGCEGYGFADEPGDLLLEDVRG